MNNFFGMLTKPLNRPILGLGLGLGLGAHGGVQLDSVQRVQQFMTDRK